MKKKMVSWCLLSMLISILNLAFTFLVSIYLCIFLSTGLLVLTLTLRAKKMVQKMPTPQKEVQRKMFITQMLYFFILLIVVACINTLFIWQGNFYFGIGLIAFGIFHILFKFITKKEQLKKIL